MSSIINTKNPVIFSRLTPQLKAEAARVTQATGITLNQFVRDALTAYLKDYRQQRINKLKKELADLEAEK